MTDHSHVFPTLGTPCTCGARLSDYRAHLQEILDNMISEWADTIIADLGAQPPEEP